MMIIGDHKQQFKKNNRLHFPKRKKNINTPHTHTDWLCKSQKKQEQKSKYNNKGEGKKFIFNEHE